MEAVRRLLNALRALLTPSHAFGVIAEDPDAFLGAARRVRDTEWLNGLLARPEAWDELSPAQLARLLRFAAMAYGTSEDSRRVAPLRALYTTAIRRVAVDERAHVLRQVARDVERLHRAHPEAGGYGWTRALAPFIHDESEGGIVSFAAHEFARLLPLEGGDPLTGPRHLIAQLSEVGDDRRRGWVLRGLLALGDRRVIGVVKDALDLLGADGRETLLGYDAPEIEAGVVDFYIDWLEQSARDQQSEVTAAIAETLARFAAGVKGRTIVEIERRLPASSYPAGEAVNVHGRWTVPQYAQVIAPRLLAMATHDDLTPVALDVLRAWGIADRQSVRAVYH